MPIAYRAQILDPADPADSDILDTLRRDPGIELLDHHGQQLASLEGLRPAPDPDLLAEPGRWAFYPWRRAAVAVLGPRGFRALRLDRNRNSITAVEQDRLAELSIGVAGLSVGHIIAHTLAMQGVCGNLRLADFDELELSNLNRVPATVFDLGVNKAYVAARRIAEIDPYLPVEVFDTGLNPETLDDFVDGLDIVVEECDSLHIKAVLRMAAQQRRIPVLMATSDRGIVDVERFDHEPGRPILHGLLGQLDIDLLPGMSNREKIPHILRHLEAERLSARIAASLLEIDKSLSTWPQTAADVGIGACAVTEAVRRIGLGEELRSGRTRLDIGWALDQIHEPEMTHHSGDDAEWIDSPGHTGTSVAAPGELLGDLAVAAMRAPSGGNVQPWRIGVRPDEVEIGIAPTYTSTMDVGFRGSAVAVGAALLNTRIAAAAHGALGEVSVSEDAGGVPLQVRLRLGTGADADLAGLFAAMMARETNRHHGEPHPIDGDLVTALTAAAEHQGGRLRLLTERADIERAAMIFAAADRIRFLTPHLHAEMISELRWPGDPDPDAGIDVRNLEFDEGDMAVFGVLRRPDVMAQLAGWDAGSALGDDMRDRILASSALAVISVPGHNLRDYAAGGSAVEAVWITASQRGIGAQPVSPVFLYAQTAEDLHELSPSFAGELGALQREFDDLIGLQADESIALTLRLAHTPPTSLPSRRSRDRLSLAPIQGATR
ncbi:Rv1355c family protein [Mycolicibacterium frederiksbergense]|uniref:Rv1355c family protein n=1 Tax=Mycolicibacterium frederiksbergense TaxID=117567 RepID=A0A6H0SBW5_9MYCO|nr:Rv1355c family protein [Mycolicibacterium frederiksbergense]QIV85122.1 Rv1355c family protein [Mycolicibacterium frederiksbergense]